MPQKKPKVILDSTAIHNPSRGSGQQLMIRIVAVPTKRHGEWEYVVEKADPLDRDFKDILGNINWRRADIPTVGTEHNIVTGYLIHMLCQNLHRDSDKLDPASRA